jgi:glutathione S-transferase
MSLTLHYHPLASFCWKVLIALYENDTPFEKLVVDLGDEASRAAFFKLWPVGKFPVLQDEVRDQIVPESSIIIDYLDQYFPGRVIFVPKDADLAWQTRLADRFFDLYVHEPMQKIVTDKLRPAGNNDTHGVEAARSLLRTALGMVDKEMAGRIWAIGEAFTMADCAASPALFYADKVTPLSPAFPNAAAYLQRLQQRPAFARVLAEAEPYFKMFPG